jgi:protein-tyrosine phosphatase
MREVAICFVCLGNICRSPTAEAVFSRLAALGGHEALFRLDSAGTGAWHAGQRADVRSRRAAQRRGYELTSRARQLESLDFERFDYIVCMDERNLVDVQRLRGDVSLAPPLAPWIGLLRDFEPEARQGSSVPDPYYGGDGGFDEVLDICEQACAGLLAHILSSGNLT